MRYPTLLTILVLSVILVGSGSAWATVPTGMTVQGRLTDASGDPLPAGSKTFTFKIFNAPNGGTEIWPGGPGEQLSVVTDDRGLFNVGIGTQISIPPSAFSNLPRYLEITVDDGVNPPQTMPRILLLTGPYAYRAAVSDDADNADLLGGQPGSYYRDAVNLIGTISVFNYSAYEDLTNEGYLNNNSASDLLTRTQSDIRHVNATGDQLTGSLTFNTGTEALRVDANSREFISFDNSGDALLRIGGSSSGQLFLSYQDVLKTRLWGGPSFGQIQLYDGDGTMTVDLAALSTGGGRLQLRQEDGTFGMSLSGGTTSDGAILQMYSAAGSNTMLFDADLAGTNAVVLPNGAIQASEIQDEPGVAQTLRSTSLTLTGPVQVVLARSLVCPASGYVMALASGTMRLNPSASSSAFAVYGVSTSTSSLSADQSRIVQEPLGSSGTHYQSIAAQKVFSVSAGSRSFYLLASGLDATVDKATMSLVFFTSNYGTVSNLVSASEAAGFDEAIPHTVAKRLPDGSEVTETVYEVDLRELEIKAARAEAESERARRELAEAELRARMAQETNDISYNSRERQR